MAATYQRQDKGKFQFKKTTTCQCPDINHLAVQLQTRYCQFTLIYLRCILIKLASDCLVLVIMTKGMEILR